ncbi:type VII secretion-associated serine protease mycosin [Micromonospora siamensis]|uniref:Type VII secretion-associated serine protease mycosin n=1 Tax=Micromonospora siamensis TaxID=299152 RepID=A0A1C5HCI4_9ACTN|nr:type VII secretion-associated serine protease mycosin [Micromonospora siamensis]
MGLPTAASADDGAARVRGDQWHLRYLRVAEAQRISQGAGVTVAVPDTGVAPHPDLALNLLPGRDFLSGADDGRHDADSHGTSMAGLIAAHGRGLDLGAMGVAPKAKLLPILCSPPHGRGDPDALARGIEYAVGQQVGVVSISSGGGSSPRLKQAITSAIKADIVVVAAAGNRPEDLMVSYPASEPGVIAVGGVDRSGNHAAVSVTGSEIDIAAPAVDIVSTSIDGKYSKGTGTSSATAIVAGAAALIRSRYPKLSAEEVAHRLTATAVDKGPPGRDDQYGYGVIDLVAALTADVPPWGAGTASDPPAAPITSAAGGPATTAVADPPGGKGGDGGATVRGLATLGVLVAAGGGWALVRRRRRADDPPPRISR